MRKTYEEAFGASPKYVAHATRNLLGGKANSMTWVQGSAWSYRNVSAVKEELARMREVGDIE